MMQVEVDTGSGTYVSLGEQHLWSVPYAFRAKTAEYATDMYLNDLGNVEITGLVGGEVLQWDGVNEVWKANQLPTAPTQFISFTGKELWYEEWHAEEAIATTPTGVVHVEIGIGLGVSTNSYLGSAYYTPPIGSNVVPLHLPNQSVVTNFTAFRSGNVNVRLYRQNLSNPTAIEEMARVNELDPSSDATINFAMINNESYSYFIFVEPVYHSVPPGSISEFDITGLKVGYTMP